MGILGMGALSPYREINVEKSFNSEKTNELQVYMTNIPVHVLQTKAGNEIECHLYGKAKRGIELVSEINGNTVSIQAKRMLDGLPIEDVALDVYIPENYGKDVLVKTTSGSVKVNAIRISGFTCLTSSGGLETDQLTADRMTVKTTSGLINIKDLESKELSITGTSSNVTITCREFSNRIIDIETTSGNTIVTLPGTAGFKYRVVTSGKFKSDFPIDKPQKTGKIDLEGAIGQENNQVFIHASSGNISLVID